MKVELGNGHQGVLAADGVKAMGTERVILGIENQPFIHREEIAQGHDLLQMGGGFDQRAFVAFEQVWGFELESPAEGSGKYRMNQAKKIGELLYLLKPAGEQGLIVQKTVGIKIQRINFLMFF